jgi:hypothetical protein
MNDVPMDRGAFGAHHLNESDMALYVINGLALERAAEVESHVACCDACACALAREAQLEMALEMLAERGAAADAAYAPDFDAVTCEVSVKPEATPNVTPMAMPLDAVVAALPVVRVETARPANDVARAAARRASRARAGLGLGAAIAAAAAFVLWLSPGARPDANEDVAKYGTVSTDASGMMVALDQNKTPSNDKLDGG